MSENRRFSLRAVPRPLRWLLGLIPAVLSMLVLLSFPPQDRSPYLIAYPGVILSAWFFGLGGGAVCAFASAVMIENLVFAAHIIGLRELPTGSPERVLIFMIGSLVVAWIVQRTSTVKHHAEIVELRRQIDSDAAERRLSRERSSAALAIGERESRLQMALEGGRVGLWDIDLEHGNYVWSDEHYRILGFDPGSVLAGYETMKAATHPEDRDPMEALFLETKSNGRPFCCEYRVVWPDGTVRWVEAQAKYETNAEGKAVRMLGVMTDITHRKQAEIVLLRTEKLAAAGRLAASIAHEINNPLEAVSNLLYLIAQAETLQSAQENAHLAMAEVMRVSRITQQTLKFHRQSESARLMRLSEIINNVLELFQGRLAISNITVDRRFEDDPELECLAGDLRQIFANLVVNSLDAMNGGSGTLTIRIRRSHDWRPTRTPGMRITLADTGCGMDMQTRRRIYEPFFTTKKDSGTGLGLWVTSEIIERQHGDLRVWSSQTPGRSGTVFSLFLPTLKSSLGIKAPVIPHEKTLQMN
jgi:PAS domain S-box-containing protein